MKKEAYLTFKNRAEKALYWLDECRRIRSSKTIDLDLSKTALLVLDMQTYFLDESSHAFVPSSPTIISSIKKLINKMKQSNRPIIFTQHIDNDDEKNMMKKWWKGAINNNSKLSNVNKELYNTSFKIVQKHQYSAFFETELEAILIDQNVDQILITGVMSHLCCETTARDAFMRGFEIFFVVDATATYNEELHIGTLRSISHGFGVCVSTEEILNEQ